MCLVHQMTRAVVLGTTVSLLSRGGVLISVVMVVLFFVRRVSDIWCG